MPPLRVLAWFAWLMLALMPVHGAPNGMTGDAQGTSQAAAMMSMADHATPDMPLTATDCCIGQASHMDGATGSCPCAATCTSVLPVLAMTGLAPVPMPAMPIPRHGTRAPSITRSPPLRPPLLQTSRLI